MGKKLKSATNNQWVSTTVDPNMVPAKDRAPEKSTRHDYGNRMCGGPAYSVHWICIRKSWIFSTFK